MAQSAKTIPLARYLFKRLAQQGVHAVHGVPGDLTLRALDHVPSAGLRWVGACDALGAGYAADGYARARGLGALMTSYGAGELSAVAAVAGSFAEDVPVVHVVGTPARRVLKNMRWYMHMHGSLGDHRLGVFREMAEKVTVAQVRLDDEKTAPELVDKAIRECLTWSRPAYIELPSDMVNASVDPDRLRKSIGSTIVPAGPHGVPRWQAAKGLLQRLYSSKQPLILVDRGQGVSTLREDINEFVRQTGIPTLCMPSGAGMIDNSLSNYYGIHSGPAGQIDTMPYVDSADFIIAFGPLFSDAQTLGWSILPDSAKLATIGRNSIGAQQMDGKDVIRQLLKQLDPTKIQSRNANLLGNFRDVPPPAVQPSDPISQTGLYLRLGRFLQRDDVVVLGGGTACVGGRDLVLPRGARVMASGMWFGAGQALPAALGAALGQTAGRTILVVGDGDFQAAAPALSTIIRERLAVTVFVVNNGGYGASRLTHRQEAPYNDVAPWKYLEAARFFGAPDDYPVETYRLETWRDMDGLMGSESFHDGKGLKLVEIVVDKYAAPPNFQTVFSQMRRNL